MPNSMQDRSVASEVRAQTSRASRTSCAPDSGGQVVAVLATTPPYSVLDKTVLATLARRTHRRTFGRGESIWRAGDAATDFHVVLSGLVKIVRRAHGEDAIVSLFGPKETIGDTAVVARGTYPADAVAEAKSVQLLSIDGEVVLDEMQRHPELAAAVNRALLHHTEALQEKIRIMSAGSVPRRLATLLVCLADRFGDETEDGATIVPVALARTELARLVGATVETTIRVMRAWERSGLVHTHPEGFVVSSATSLRAIATGEAEEAT
jgi:CRP-like cAMP-binding protein